MKKGFSPCGTSTNQLAESWEAGGVITWVSSSSGQLGGFHSAATFSNISLCAYKVMPEGERQLNPDDENKIIKS